VRFLGGDIKNIVSYYTRKYKTNDPFLLADYLKIIVQKGDLGKFSGCYMYLKKHKCIFLNSNLDYVNSKMVMAHEIGHAILHTRTNCCFMASKTFLLTSKIEIQANKFAAELLIDDELINQFRGFTLEQLSYKTGYDIELLKLKCNN
jgi:Zn-dependent peptidase ImmA (M78 family)